MTIGVIRDLVPRIHKVFFTYTGVMISP